MGDIEKLIGKSKLDNVKNDESTGRYYDGRTKDLRPILECLFQSEPWLGDECSRCTKSIQQYAKNYHHRWKYSTITRYVFEKKSPISTDETFDAVITRIDHLRNYSYEQKDSFANQEEHESYLNMVEKLADHLELAFSQASAHQIQETKEKIQSIESHIEDTEKKIAESKNEIDQSKEKIDGMQKEFISLIAIFTGLSFLACGGISAVNNILNNVGDAPILELTMVGSIWAIFIIDIVSLFMFFVARFLEKPLIQKGENTPIRNIWIVCHLLFLFLFFMSGFFLLVDRWDLAWVRVSKFL